MTNNLDNGHEYVVTLAMPDVDKRDIHVDVEDRGLRVWGATFDRYVTFPERVTAEGTRATYRDGVLEVAVPKRAPERRRVTSVEVT